MNLADLRENYTKGGLRVADVSPDPVIQLEDWLQAAKDGGITEPNAMNLATTNATGHLSVRTVLLKGLDQKGLTFFTNYRSRKARDIEANPHTAINFLWKDLERQVCLRGVCSKTSREVSENYFRSRPYGSQIGAWVSERQSEQVAVRAVLEHREEQLLEKYPEGSEVPCPDFWGGFLFQPTHVEFWQGREGRIHDRIRYRRDVDGWTIERLSP